MKRIFLLLAILPTILAAQDIIVTNSGESMKVYITDISANTVYYKLTNTDTAALRTIVKADVLVIKKADGMIINPLDSSAQPNQSKEISVQEDRFPIVDIANYHGFLLQKGNCVFIPTDSPFSYEQAGQKVLKDLMQKDGFWQVVDKIEQAHIVLRYWTRLEGKDLTVVRIQARDYVDKGQLAGTLRFGERPSGQNPEDQIEAVTNMFSWSGWYYGWPDAKRVIEKTKPEKLGVFYRP